MGPLVVNMVKTVDTIFVLSAFKRANFQSKSTKLVSSSMFTCPNWCFKMYLSCFTWLTCFLLCVCVLLLDRGYILRLFFKEQNAFSIDTVICGRLTATDPVLLLSLSPVCSFVSLYVGGLPYLKHSNREQISSNFCAHRFSLSPPITHIVLTPG